ncbi:hippurate hydrolase [Cereibacter changlensis JA139]|uniref:Hippurate hydrolase n=2 Tax=Cereibacter changlensis TaxID=402884 RepID=A0A2T4JV82_9RHOB|nr:M20 family metallopeptidase [Cereibacter changlensis]PTE21830.1 hippurate hydrolase [Cereibacter changlensis JA139]PZX48471.1 glutamate carboxypeptidase [Cereibacter changlensis]
MTETYPIRPEDIDLPAFLEELRAWVSLESPTADPAAVNAMADRAAAHATALGLSVTRHPTDDATGDLLIARHGPEDRADEILILTHLDTVHAKGALAGPLPWRQEGDKLFGPGVYDMKSGALMALEALALAGDRTVATVLFIPDEETGTYAGRLAVEAAARKARAVLVMEPARDGGKIVTGRRGSAIYRIEVHGRAAHSGTRPQDGRSAIRAAARLILTLEAMNDPARGIGVNVGVIQGGTTRNTIPALCVLDIDVRLPDRQAQEEVTAAIEALTPVDPDIRFEITGGVSRPAFSAEPGTLALLETARPIAEAMGYPLVPMTSGGGSDGNFTAALGLPTLDGLGPDGADAHTFNEHLLVPSIAPRLAMLANLLITLHEKPARGL